MKKILLFLIFMLPQCFTAQNNLGKSVTAICGNGIVEEGEECDGTPGCTSSCTLIPAGTFFVEPQYGVRYVVPPVSTLKVFNRSIKLNPDTNEFWMASNYFPQGGLSSNGGSSFVDANGVNSNQSYVEYPPNTSLEADFPLPIVGDYFIGNLKGGGLIFGETGVAIRNLNNPAASVRRIESADVGENDLKIYAAAMQTDGKILLAGRCSFSQGRIIVIRLNQDLSFDTSFFTVGYRKFSFGSDCQARAIGLQSDGKIVVAGHRVAPGSIGIILRLNTDGTLDTTFGGGGTKTFNYQVETQNNSFLLTDITEVYSMYIDVFDHIYLCGRGSAQNLWAGKYIPAMCGMLSNGADWLSMRDLDHTTQNSILNVAGVAYKISYSETTGMIYLAGYSANGIADIGLYLQRFDSVATVDSNFRFQSESQVSYYNLSSSSDVIDDMAIQNDGKIVLVGTSNGNGFYTRIMDTSLSAPSFETKNENVVLSPNPVSNSLNLQFENNLNQELKIVIVDVLGKEVYSNSNPDFNAQNSITINNLDVLSNGIFFIKIISETSAQTIKFIKR